MKITANLLVCGLISLFSSVIYAQVPIGGFNAYYGHLHNHTAYSDGQGTVDQAYSMAKANGLHFFGLAEHSNLLSTAEWSATQTAADTYNQPGVFTTFRGFEWTTTAYGHVAVINTPTLINAADAAYNTFPELITWLNTQDQNCFAFFNHPGDYNASGTEFDHFPSNLATDKIVGMEFWNKSVTFTRYYASLAGVMVNGFFSGDGMPFYDEALQRNWKIAPAGSEDNHTATWGANGYEYKTGVLAAANTRADLLAAFKARRFFSTLDKNTAISFKLNGNEMGSTITAGNYSLQILAADGDSETFSKVELLKKGIVVSTWTPGVTNVSITGSLTGADADYFYIRVYQGGNLTAVSAPIWISGGNAAPIVSITNPAANAQFQIPATVTITANASDPDGTVAKVEFYQGATKLGEDITAPYSFTWSNVPAASYSLTARATDNLGALTISAAIPITVIDPNAPVTVSSLIATGSDDAEESVSSGAVVLTSTDLELAYDVSTTAADQVVGMRFTNLNIPKAAGITNAYIQFTCDEVNSAAASLTIKGEAVDNSSTFTTTTRSISARLKTAASVSWIPAAWPTANAAGVDQRTPELKSIVQEIVNRSGYTSSSAITIIITGTGSRIAEAYEGVPASAARLYVQYSLVQQVTPTFTQIGPLCQNSTPPSFPLTSNNGITGTWSPSVISTATAGSNVYTFTPAVGQNATTATMTIVVNPQVTPTFAAVGPYCYGASIPALPTTSTNGITGTWSPAINNTVTTLYIFTPTAGQCATIATMNIVINPNVTPTFNAVGPYCAGATIPALPTTSTNGITGTWSPAINNMVTTTYTFTPDAGLCAATAALTIVINQPVVPQFSPIGPLCQNSTPPSLPLVSTNGISGTWNPAVITTGTLGTIVYHFTPDAGLCALSATLEITVSDPVLPLFAAVTPYCAGATIPALPLVSENGITGTWSPALDNTETTEYTFTPNSGQCAIITTLTVVIVPNVTPLFAQAGPYCVETTIPALPLVSTNGITGTWSPALNNLATTTYTFTPSAGQCATNASMTIVIVQTTTPTFEAVGPYCEADAIPELPFASAEGITGTWSPAINNMVTTTYTFTPDAGQCATPATMTVIVNQKVTPAFAAMGPFYQGSVPPVLPGTSLNGFTGTWEPSVISTAVVGTFTYTFTPGAGQCAAITTLQVQILPKVAPVVSITAPVNGATFTAPASITVTATASDTDGNVTGVEFFRNGVSIGSDNSAPYSVSWAGIAAGSYVLTAVATDNDGLQTTSGVVNITVNPSNTAPTVSITSPAEGATFAAPATVTITATAADADGTVSQVQFYHGTTLLGSDNTAPYSYTWTSVAAGNYVLTAVATDDDGAMTTSSAVNITVITPVTYTLSKRISAGIDDVEEYASGTILTNSDDIELVYDTKTTGNQIVGLRFNGITIPADATITQAYIQFRVDERTTSSTSLTIRGQKINNAPVFTTTSKNVSNRSKTTASTAWTPANWSTVGAAGTAQQTPSLISVVQEIIGVTGWTSGNSMVFIISGTGKRTAESYEGMASGAALLYIEFTVPAADPPLAKNAHISVPVNQINDPLNQINKLNCYPVPLRDILNISYIPEEDEKIYMIGLYSVQGELIRNLNATETIHRIQVGGLTPGIYLVRVFTDRSNIVRTIVK